MLNVDTTGRAKRVARDLGKALQAVGHPLSHTRCLEIASRMLGHPSYGMLARSIGQGPRDADDDGAPAPVVASRRAAQAQALVAAGIPADAVEGILDAVRPTSRSAPSRIQKRRTETCAEPFGYAQFDMPTVAAPQRLGGWRCLPGGEPVRFSGLADLDPAVTWWSNVGFAEHRHLGLHGTNVLHERYLPLTPAAALRETGATKPGVDAIKAAAGMAADILGSSARILGRPLHAHPCLSAAFAEGWSAPNGGEPLPARRFQPTDRTVIMAGRSHSGRPVEAFSMPRVSYARSMMAEPMPVGAYEHVDLAEIPTRSARMRWIADRDDVAFVRIERGAAGGGSCTVRSCVWFTDGKPLWIAKPYLDVLAEATRLHPAEVLLLTDMAAAGTFLPTAAASFLADADEGSWSDGIVAEAIWQSGLPAMPRFPVSWQEGVGGAYLLGLDHARTCREAVRLSEAGAAVCTYGLNRVLYTLAPPT